MTEVDIPAVLGFPAALLRRLPAPWTLSCRAVDVEGDVRAFWVTNSKRHHPAAVKAGLPAVDGHTWMALTVAAEARQAALAVAQWLTPYKWGTAQSWQLRGTLYDLTGGALRARDRATAWDDIPLRVTVGGVLAHFGAELVEVDPPPTAATRPEGLL